jgi:hypothetical protein
LPIDKDKKRHHYLFSLEFRGQDVHVENVNNNENIYVGSDLQLPIKKGFTVAPNSG